MFTLFALFVKEVFVVNDTADKCAQVGKCVANFAIGLLMRAQYTTLT